MRVALFDYHLPEELIAQFPTPDRDASRLMVVDRATQTISHRQFHDIGDYLVSGDRLVVNDTRVLPARLHGRRKLTGGKWEGLFIREISSDTWEMIMQTRGKLAVGETILLEPGDVAITLGERLENGNWSVRIPLGVDTGALLRQVGTVPLPPYIRGGEAEASDWERYQTVYAARDGSVAAPTAGLHFTNALFERLADAGIGRERVTLHVGPGTFFPVKVEDSDDHVMHREWCQVDQNTVDRLNGVRAAGRRLVAVGTTTVRVLETAALGTDLATGRLQPFTGETDIFIKPGYSFRVIDALITNFHLPKSTLLMLVSALAGYELIRAAYAEAVDQRYRFYSYGDAMLIL